MPARRRDPASVTGSPATASTALVLDGGDGIDTVNDSLSAQTVWVSLMASAGSGGDAAGDTYRRIENIIGGQAGDVLVGEAGADSMEGGAGNDQLYGHKGLDRLNGGSGADWFIFGYGGGGTGGDTLNALTVVEGFSHADGDRLHLGVLDANACAVYHRASTFIGSNVVTGSAGRLCFFHERQSGVGDVTVIEGDTNGDGVGDFFIELLGRRTLTQSDFLL